MMSFRSALIAVLLGSVLMLAVEAGRGCGRGRGHAYGCHGGGEKSSEESGSSSEEAACNYNDTKECNDNDADTCVCPEGFTLCGGSCWRYENSSLISYADAVSLCTSLGAEVALPTSAAENQCAECVTSSSLGAWIGLRGTTTLDSFVTSDGSAPAYTNWHEDQPNLSGCESYNCDNCAYVSSADGKWYVYRCDFIYLTLCHTRTCCA